jgi:hypothetical protein
MSTLAITRLMSNARVHLPGALDTAIEQELFSVMDEFLQTSRIWREDIELTATADETEYEILSEEGGSIFALLALKNENDIPVAATMAVPGMIVLNAAPSSQATYTATVALTAVYPTSAELPDFPEWLIQSYGEVLVAGLIGRMMTQPAKPYFNERLAIFHGRRFRNGIARARLEAQRKNLHGAQAWSFPQSFAPCRR